MNIYLQGDDDVEFMPIMSLDEDGDAAREEIPLEIPLLPLKNTVLFPGVVIPITIGRDKSIKAVKDAYASHKIIGVVAQLDGNMEEPQPKDLYTTGTIARIIKLLKMPDGSNTAIIQGRLRFATDKITAEEPYFKMTYNLLSDIKPAKDDDEFEAIVGNIKDIAINVARMSPNMPTEAGIMIRNIESPGFLVNFVSNNLTINIPDKQILLEENDLKIRARKTLIHLNAEHQMLDLKNQIQDKVRGDIEKQQRDYFLNQQLKTIQEELGGDNFGQAIVQLRERAAKMKWPVNVSEVFEKELVKLERTNPNAAEYSININYLELLLDLPWETFTEDKFDLKKARKILDTDHYGLDKVKDRIIEFLAVLKLKGDMKSPILCLVGPPGVGKTSLGRSVAKALGREYVRMALGGMRDEAEIRGHRRTYIGAMPGRVIQSLKKAKSSNPVFVLDEVDKVGNDFRGDPASALLEVLDPEQNHEFYDHYLELNYDLSKVMFIATANAMSTIHPALIDRMEVIEVTGYSLEEKVLIAHKHLVPKQLAAHGLKDNDVELTDKILSKVISDYTRESGVRELDRKLAQLMRYVARNKASEIKYDKLITEKILREILGISRYDNDVYARTNLSGVAIGLAWTSVGGDILYIEVLKSKGKGNLKLTGNLGNVMKESVDTALSFIKAHCEELKLSPDMFAETDLHVHVPEGAVPKDGPSAGITMLTAITSALINKPIKPYTAMTGEITLRGKVLPVGGIKEKVLAARRAGIKDIIMSRMNERDINEINPAYIKGIKFHYVETMNEVLKLALGIKTLEEVA